MQRQLTDADRRVGYVEITTLADSVERAADLWPHREIVFPDERATFREFADRVDHFARGLLGLGVGVDEKIGVLATQGIDYLAALIGAVKIGAVAVPINSRYKPRELRHIIANSDMSVLFTTTDHGEYTDFPALLADTLPSLAVGPDGTVRADGAPLLRHVVLLDDAESPPFLTRRRFDEAAATPTADEVLVRSAGVSIRNTAIVMYTSGTTADPKGAMLCHEGLVRVGIVVGRTRFHLTESDQMWTALPLYHIGGIAFAFACFAVGASYVHTGFFDPAVAIEQLADERCTVAVPAFETIWFAILKQPRFEEVDLSPLRVVFNVGARERLAQMQEMLPDAIQVSGYGATESSSFLCVGEPEDSLEERISACGRPIPGMDMRIVSPETGRECAPGEVGEIVYRGWSRLLGYYNDPERSAATIDENGFFHSGDLGKIDDMGRLRFVSRLKDMLKVGGENVAAAEVEGHLITHPAVMFAQVVAAPDARYSEVVAAFVELQPGATADEWELIEHCLGSIATFKVPRYVRFVEEWPMSGTKIKKHVLRDRIAAELEAAGITEAPKLRSTS